MHQFLTLLKIHRNSLIAVLLLLAALILIFSVRTGKESLRMFQQVVLDSVGHAQQLLHAPLVAMEDASLRFQQVLRLEEENRRLKSELNRLIPTLSSMEELRQENRRLRSLLAMTDDPIYRSIGARVVGSSSSSFSRVMVLDAGADKGVRVDVPVLSAKGLVGRVVEVGRGSSLALSLLDPNSRVPVMDQRSRIQAIVSGRNTTLLKLEYVATGADVREGDTVITSGIGGIFPKGLQVGRIDSVEPHGADLFQKVAVRSAVAFDRLEEVSILLPLFEVKAP